VSRRILLTAAALVAAGAGLTTAAGPAHAAGVAGSVHAPLLRVTARCDGPGSKMMLGIHPSRTGGIVAATRITHVRHPHWVGVTVVGDHIPSGLSSLSARHGVVQDWVRSSQSWPKPVVATYFSRNGSAMCTQMAESTPRVDMGVAMSRSFTGFGLRVLRHRGVVEVGADLRPGTRARVAVNIRTAAGFQHRVRFVRAGQDGIDIRFRTFKQVGGYTRALARVMTGHGPSKIIQLAHLR